MRPDGRNASMSSPKPNTHPASLSDILVRDIMAVDFLRLDPAVDVLTAVQKMTDSLYSAVCVVADGRLCGLFTAHELKRCVAENSSGLVSLKLGDVMNAKPLTVTPEQRLDEVLVQMKAHGMGVIPVVSAGGELMGIVTIQHALDSFDSFTETGGKDISVDPVTRLYNLRFFNQYLDVEIARSVRYGYMFSLLNIEIDGYDQTAARLSREQLNLWLQIFAKMLKYAEKKSHAALFVRRSDVAVRWTDRQFMLILPETKKDGAVICAERLLRVLRDQINPELEEAGLPVVSISIGAVEFPSDATKSLMLIEKAKDALKSARHAGGNRIKCYEASR